MSQRASIDGFNCRTTRGTQRKDGSRVRATAPLPGVRWETGGCENPVPVAAVRRPETAPPSDDGATQAGGHAAQVDRAPFGEVGPHGQGAYQPVTVLPLSRPPSGIDRMVDDTADRGVSQRN
ncbi:hypothetical protein GCM10028790_26780 [Micromonospora taraxaci]